MRMLIFESLTLCQLLRRQEAEDLHPSTRTLYARGDLTAVQLDTTAQLNSQSGNSDLALNDPVRPQSARQELQLNSNWRDWWEI